MNSFTGTDVYGIRWWIDNKDNDDFLSSIKYTEKYDSIMTMQQIQKAKNEFEKLDVEEIQKVIAQVYLYIYIRKERAWWCIDTDKIQLWFSKNC
jgi:uncharacterized protein YqfB (UPF0267 family)